MSANELPQGQAARVELLAKMSTIGKQPAAAGFALAPVENHTNTERGALCDADALSYEAEQSLYELIAWAKRTSKTLEKKTAQLTELGVPFDGIRFRTMQGQLGALVWESEQKYQRSWHAHALGLGAGRRAA
jgi:hypothetical protein